MNVKILSTWQLGVAHLVPVSTVTILLSRFESTAIGNGAVVSDRSENLPSKDLAVLSARFFLDDLSVEVMVKRERQFFCFPYFLVL